jgi:uncharacterized protein YdaU (DUF1376 family)
MSKPVWFPLYANDFLASNKVSLMTTEEVGSYFILLCREWADPLCRLPSDEASLQRMGRFTGEMTRIRACFTEKDGFLYNERLYAEWNKTHEIAEVRARAGKKGMEKRWDNKRITNDITNTITKDNQSQSQSQSQKNRRTSEPSESHSDKEIKTSGTVQDSVPMVNGVGVWNSYAEAYRGRYGVLPVRNRTVNSHLKQICERLGAQEAPQVAEFYLHHNKQFYVVARHPTNLLLRDCEGLRTEWVTGIKSTSGEARNLELKDNVLEQVKRVEALMKRGDA